MSITECRQAKIKGLADRNRGVALDKAVGNPWRLSSDLFRYYMGGYYNRMIEEHQNG